MGKVKKILFNRQLIMCYILISVSMTMTYLPSLLVKLLIWSSFGWALIYIIYTVISDKSLLKMKYTKAAIIFILTAVLTAVLTLAREKNISVFIDNIQIVISYIVYFLFLLMPDKKSRGIKDFKLIGYVMLIMYFIPVVMSAIQALFNIRIDNFMYTSHGYLSWKGRYYTLFQNPNGYSSVCAILICIIIYLRSLISNKILKSLLIFYEICAIISIGMCASRGVLVAVVAGIVVYNLAPLIRSYKKEKISVIFWRVIKTLSVSFIAAVYMYFASGYIDNMIPMIRFYINNRQQSTQISEITKQETMPSTTVTEPTNSTVMPTEAITVSPTETQTVMPTEIITIKPTESISPTSAQPTTQMVTSPTNIQYTFAPGRDYQEQGPDPSNGRFEKWLYAAKTVIKRPLFGCSMYGEKSISCHNAFITVLLAYGIIGFTVFMLIILSQMKKSVERYINCQSNEVERRIILTILIGILVKALTGDILILAYENVNIIFYVLLGIVANLKEVEKG